MANPGESVVLEEAIDENYEPTEDGETGKNALANVSLKDV